MDINIREVLNICICACAYKEASAREGQATRVYSCFIVKNKDDLFIYLRNCMIASIQSDGERRGNLLRRETSRDMSVKQWNIMFFVMVSESLSYQISWEMYSLEVPIRDFL
jgi:hypothetical protein